MYSNDEIVAMIAVLAKRVEKLEKPGDINMKSIDSYLSELLKQSQRMS
ncbi:MAG: hypothetical protein FWC34_10940 [Bacteroidetes bacterium]|nr:hypothetical protein [Bacteroidota bacterium]MCL2302943.1 hypothetical protein [Lentimicrobiaceae bacterium]